MFDTIWIARVVPSRANTSQALIDTGKPCDANDADFSVLHSVGETPKKEKKVLTYQVRETFVNGLYLKIESRHSRSRLSKVVCRLLINFIPLQAEIVSTTMSDSGTESTSSEGYDGDRNRLTITDEVTSSRYSHHSSGSERRRSPASSITSGGKSPPGSPLSGAESKSPRSTPLSPKSQQSGIMSPSEEGSPRSLRSLSKSPPPMSPSPLSPTYRQPASPTYRPFESPKSHHSGNNCLESPQSDRSSSRSAIQDNGSCLSPPNDSKSMRFEDAESKASDLEVDAQRSADNSLKSYSYKNSESRQSSPKSPRSGPSSVKSLISARSSPKSFKSGPASPMDDQESDKHSPAHSGPRSPEEEDEENNGSFNELDGEQISDGDIEDEPELMSKSKPTPITHGEDLSDVSDLESIDGPEESIEQNTEIDKPQEQDRKQEIVHDEENTEKEDKTAPVGLTEESEQLDFEADGQWKDERDEGKLSEFKEFQIKFIFQNSRYIFEHYINYVCETLLY